jgi:hypothetical protein
VLIARHVKQAPQNFPLFFPTAAHTHTKTVECLTQLSLEEEKERPTKNDQHCATSAAKLAPIIS